jgi:DNA-binding transcriptional ArsR family regulator
VSKERLLDWAEGDGSADLDTVSAYILYRLALFADAEYCAWAPVKALAGKIKKSERTVQYRLRELERLGLIKVSGRVHRLPESTRSVPIYQLAPEVEGLGKRAPRMGAKSAPIDGHGCKNGGGMGATGLHPHKDTKDTIVSADALTGRAQAPEAGSFDQVKAAWIGKAPERVDPVLSVKAWKSAAIAVGEARLAAAALRYLAEAGEVQRGHVRELHQWLKGKRYEAWLGEGTLSLPLELAVPATVPPEVFAVVASTPHGEGAARSWLGKADWDEVRRVVVVGSTAARWLKMNVAQQLRDIGVEIEERAA